MKTASKIFALLITAASLTNYSFAATFVWSSIGNISTDADVSTSGTLFSAQALNGSGVIVNTVSFSPLSGTISTDSNVTLSLTSGNSTAGNPSGLSTTYASLLGNGIYLYGPPGSITFNNLTAGDQYQVEFFSNDSRPGTGSYGLTLSAGNSTTIFDRPNDATAGVTGQFAVGTFTADAATQIVDLDPGTAWPFLNALQIRDLSATSQPQANGYPIIYTLPNAWRVSINIYDSNNHVVRQLICAVPQSAGTHTEFWDGLDDDGKAVPAGAYSWKLLSTPGLQAQYLMTPGDNYIRTGWDNGAPGNHTGPTSVAVDTGKLFIGAVGGENAPLLTSYSEDASSKYWDSASYPQALASGGDGPGALSSMDGHLYGLNPHDYIIFQPSNAQPGATYSYQANVLQLWDCLWPGDTRGDWHYTRNQTKDMDAYHPSGLSAVLIVSDTNHNAVRWFDPTSGNVLDTNSSIPSPLGVAIDNGGNVLVISGTNVLKISYANHATVTTVITGLTAPYRLSVDRTDGSVYVAERQPSEQVKRFNASYQLQQQYGAAGGRLFGTYVNTNFSDINDITADGSGGFIVAEPFSLPRRVAQFNRQGNLVHEWLGSFAWSPPVVMDGTTNGQTQLWVVSGGSSQDVDLSQQTEYLERIVVNTTTGTWQVGAVFDLGLITQNNDIVAVRYHNGTTYFCVTSAQYIKIWKLNTATWTASFCAEVYLANQQTSNNDTTSWVWTDINGDGIIQDSEKRSFPNLVLHVWNQANKYCAPDFSTYYLDQATGYRYQLKVTGWNAIGSPIYQDPPPPVFSGITPWESSHGKISDGARFTGDGSTALYSAESYDNQGWGNQLNPRMVKWDIHGNYQWTVGKRAPLGQWMRECSWHPDQIAMGFDGNIGTTHGCVLANDYDGGYLGAHPAFDYCWDPDGLWVGGLFESCNYNGVPTWEYGQSDDNFNGDIYTDSSGNVFYASTQDNSVKIYKITGWDNWYRTSGAILVSKLAPNNTGSGLLGQYYGNGSFTNPTAARVDSTVNFNWGTSTPSGTGITSNSPYSVRWTGYIIPQYNESYTFYINSTQNNRLWINGRQMIESWYPKAKPSETSCATACPMQAGKPYEIQIDYSVTTGTSLSQLSWSSTSQAKQIIPANNLYPLSIAPPQWTFPTIPATIECEDYDEGGEGISYHSTDSGVSYDAGYGGAVMLSGGYRFPNAVDVVSCYQNRQTFPFIGFNLRNVTAGEWEVYTVNVPASGNYKVSFRYQELGSGTTLHLQCDGANIGGSISLPNTNTTDYSVYSTSSPVTFSLPSGVHQLKIVFDSCGTPIMDKMILSN